MKKNIFLSILLSCLTIILITSCSKKNDDTPVITDNEELLTSTSWVEQNLTFTEAGQDKTSIYNSTYGDLSVNFNADGTYSVTSENYSVLTSGTWTIDESKTTLTATDINSAVFNITIVSISGTSLELRFTYLYNNGFINVAVTIEGTFIPSST